MFVSILSIVLPIVSLIYSGFAETHPKCDQLIKFAERQYTRILPTLRVEKDYPSEGSPTSDHWRTTPPVSGQWTAGFYPGVLWHLYNQTKKNEWKTRAIQETDGLFHNQFRTDTHDIGFMIMCSYGSGYEFTKNSSYPKIIINAAHSLAKRFNPHVGAIRSWNNRGNSSFLVIVDNMMNLDLLFKAYELTSNKTLYDMAVKHANTTIRAHLRKDYSSYHIVDFNNKTGAIIRQYQGQGYNDSSTWARGQAWLINGFTTTYKYTKMHHFLETAEKLSDYYIKHLPEDGIAPWDFNVPKDKYHYIPRDTSSAAIVANGFFELFGITKNQTYLKIADKIMDSLSSDKYRADGKPVYRIPALLTNATSSGPNAARDSKSSEQNIVRVNLKDSVINGKTETSVDGKELYVFRGIPYAEPPVGDLRFKKPLPLKSWPQTIDAYEWPNPCYQNTGQSIMILTSQNLTEDCLYLNIMSPIDSLNSNQLKAVIFYIHGGALLWGSAGDSGDVITTRGDVVFVNIQYRLTAFGFLYSGTEEAPGNVGIWDQALALEWVNDNIRYFGGDPNRITIMGMSAGSWSVGLHIMSPISRNMFRNAVMQSAAITDNILGGEPEDRIKEWLKGAKLIGCNDENSTQFNKQIMDCLRKVDPKKLAEVAEMPEMQDKTIRPSSPLVVVDGHFLPKKPSEILKFGDFKQDMTLMVSTAADEGSMFLKKIDFERYHPLNPKNMSFDEAFDQLKQLSESSNRVKQINGKQVSKLYFTGLSDSSDADLLRRTVGIALGDYFIGCPTIEFAKEVFRRSNFKTNIFQYHYNSKIAGIGLGFPKWWGPSHAEDYPATFGLPLKQVDNFSQRDRQISFQMIDLFTSIAKNDCPPPQSGSQWQKYYAIDDNIIAPYYEITHELKPNTNFGVGLKINECQYLWKKYLL